MDTDNCPVCGTPTAVGQHCCGNIGPRIGDQAPRCVLTHGHSGDHRAHESWNRTITRWHDIGAAPAARDVDSIRAEHRANRRERCVSCRQPWPCDTAVVLAELDGRRVS